MLHTIQSIHIYPIKSLGGINLREGKALKSGMQYDRNWMLVDDANVFMTQRIHHEMCLFQQSIEGEMLVVRYGDAQLDIPLQHLDRDQETAQIWDDSASVYEVNPEISQWFSQHLQKSCRLMRISSTFERMHKKKGNLEMSLSDGYPYLVVGTGSLANLNTLLDQDVVMDRFRPNIVVHTDTAHTEDTWGEYAIGSAGFKSSHPCARCNLITINPDTALAGKEPLKTLSTYRKVGNRVNFGMNVFCESEGKLSVGDTIIFA